MRYCLLVIMAFLIGCKSNQLSDQEARTILSDAQLFHNSLDELTDIIVHDIFSPPVASRVYVYPCIAAYEVIQQGSQAYPSMGRKLNGLQEIPKAQDTSQVYLEVAALEAFMQVGKSLIFSEDKMVAYRDSLLIELDNEGVNQSKVKASLSYGKEVADHILDWADKDNYKQTRSYPKFSLSDDPSRWKPTPPAYMEGIEPHWNKLRTMVLDSAAQFKIAPPPAFDLSAKSKFRELTKEVYDVVNTLSEEEKAIASFWDCNPFVMNQVGHIMYATKKITPGGHWMGISNVAAETAELSLAASMRSSMLVSIALYDAFIACWDEKYRSSLVRPETVINEHIDEDWVPLLQTPPFPEHTSGHSVISTAASIVLTELYGDNFAYRDDVELKYGLPVRTYKSFREAASEAAISRLYGGIHYMPAIREGEKQGAKVGDLIVDRLAISRIEN